MFEKNYYSIPEIARLLGVSRIYIYKKVKGGEIIAEKIGRNYAVKKETLDVLLGNKLSDSDKKLIDEGVKKTIKEYGEVLEKLGKE